MQNNIFDVTREQRGVILITVLLLLFLLMAASMGSLVSVHNDYRVTTNLRGGMSALYLADSGIEWAKEQISAATVLPLQLSDHTASLATGRFAVSFLSLTQPFPLVGQAVVRSQGTVSDAGQTVQARITKRYDFTDAALVVRGAARAVRFTGSTLTADGRDHDPTGLTILSNSPARFGATVGDPALLALINDALSDAQVSGFISHEIGQRAIAQSDWLNGSVLTTLAEGICSARVARTTALSGVGNFALAGVSLGSQTSPETNCITGTNESGDALLLENSSGAGILVVQNAELILSGTFSWTGLIIVTGRDVGLRVSGPENKQIVGALIVNETGSVIGPGPALVDIQGTLRILYSRRAFDLAAALIPSAVLQQGYASLPFRLHQDYWRTVSP